MITSDGTWLEAQEKDVVMIRTSTDHYNAIRYANHELQPGEVLKIASRRIWWGPDGGSEIVSRRRIENSPVLREFLATSDLVAEYGGVWLRNIPEELKPEI